MTPRMKMRGYSGTALVLLTATVAYLMVQQPIQVDETAKANTTASKALEAAAAVQKQVDANAAALADANRRLVALGKPPVPVLSTPPPVYQDEFTASEAAAVRVIVADQIAKAKTPLSQAEISQIAKAAAALIPKPADGKSPTAAQMQTYAKLAVASYCLQDRCVRQPQDGAKGDKGDPAPKVTDEELLRAAQAALAAYCAQEEKPCTPKDGVDGKAGENGKDAPPPYSVVDVDCVGDGEQSVWRTYLSNGADQRTITSKGPCRVGPDPD